MAVSVGGIYLSATNKKYYFIPAGTSYPDSWIFQPKGVPPGVSVSNFPQITIPTPAPPGPSPSTATTQVPTPVPQPSIPLTPLPPATSQYIVPGASRAITLPSSVTAPSNWTPVNTGFADLVPQTSSPQMVLSPGGNYLTSSGNIYKLPPLTPVPPGWTLIPPQATQAGTVWNTPGGGTVFALPGSVIPSTWTVSSVAYDSSKAILVQNNISLSPDGGGWYSDLQGNPVFVPGGLPVPVGWRTTYAPAGSTGAGIDPTFDPTKAQGNAPPATKSYFTDTVSMILGAIGIVGVGYIGYLFITNPAALKAYVDDLSKAKDLAIDAAAIAAAIAFLAGISFFTYEFFKAYEDTGSVAGALGQLTAEMITVIVETIVTAAETLLKDLFNSVSSGVSTVIKEI